MKELIKVYKKYNYELYTKLLDSDWAARLAVNTVLGNHAHIQHDMLGWPLYVQHEDCILFFRSGRIFKEVEYDEDND